MKLKNIFIPSCLLTILVAGICKHYYNLDLLSMNSVCVICVTSFIAFVNLFVAIQIIAYSVTSHVIERQNALLDRYVIYLKQHITDSDVKIVKTMRDLSLACNEADDKRAKVIVEEIRKM